jgi:hypothetical protein
MNIDRKSWTRSAAAVPVISAVKYISSSHKQLVAGEHAMIIDRSNFHYVGAAVANQGCEIQISWKPMIAEPPTRSSIRPGHG